MAVRLVIMSVPLRDVSALFLRIVLLRGGALQLAKCFHFAVGLRGLALFAIYAGQAEMGLRGKRSVLFEGQHMFPGFLCESFVSIEKSGFAEKIQGFGHVRFQLVRADQRLARFVKFSELQQGFAEAVKRFGASGLNLRFELELFGGFVPLLGARVKLAELQVQSRSLRTQFQRFLEFAFGARHVAQRGIILRHHLMGAGGIREAGFELVKNLLGKQAAGAAVVVEQIRIIGIFCQRLLQDGYGFRQSIGFQQGDAERALFVRFFQVRDGFRGKSLRQQRVS